MISDLRVVVVVGIPVVLVGADALPDVVCPPVLSVDHGDVDAVDALALEVFLWHVPVVSEDGMLRDDPREELGRELVGSPELVEALDVVDDLRLAKRMRGAKRREMGRGSNK
jgi:hypothetical protein